MAKQEAEHSNTLNISLFKNQGYLEKGQRRGNARWTYPGGYQNDIDFITTINGDGNDNIEFRYTCNDRYTGEKEDMNYKIRLTTTPCHYGGRRYWFVCPLTKNEQYCGRRVGVLFSINKWFGCRHCGEIAYRAQMRGGRYRGSSVSLPDIEKIEKKVKRKYYNGQPTRKYKRLMRLKKKLDWSLILMAARVNKRFERIAGLKK